MRPVLAAALALLLAGPALAQAPEGTPTRIRGTIEKVDGHTLVVRTGLGGEVAVAMGPGFPVSAVVKRSLADIKAGDFVASTSVRREDGRLHALELHFLPPTAREGQTPYDLAPESLMTNARVAGIAAAPQGQILKVTYGGSEAEIVVGPEVPVVAAVPGDSSLLRPGAAIFVAGVRRSDGTVVGTRATVEKDGVKPPM
jgi:hypothetical protein